jgi:cysteine desulfurase
MNYFDHAASAPIYPEVLDVLTQTMRDDFANPGARHILGQTIQENIQIFREDFLKSLDAEKNDYFIFTSSATESNNTVIRGLNFKEGDVVLYCKGDHLSVTTPIELLVGQLNVVLKEIILNKNGIIDFDYFLSLIDEKVKLVVLTHINNQSGVVSDFEKISKVVKEKSSAHVHVDAVQSFGKIDCKSMPSIDSISLTSHKLGGPKGVAGLFLKKNHKVNPLLMGGGQESNLRSSTLAYPLIAGFHKAMKISLEHKASSFIKMLELNELIRSTLTSGISSIHFPFQSTSPYIISFVIPGISSDIILRHLETKKVYISSTSACSSRIEGFNPSLFALNIPENYHKNFLRISLGPNTSLMEVEILLKEFLGVWNNLKHMQKK